MQYLEEQEAAWLLQAAQLDRTSLTSTSSRVRFECETVASLDAEARASVSANSRESSQSQSRQSRRALLASRASVLRLTQSRGTAARAPLAV